MNNISPHLCDDLKPKYKAMIIEIITRYIPQGKIVLFGSRATQTARHGSDIDITIDIGKKIVDHNLALLRLDIEENLNIPMKVDISDFYELPVSFQKTIREKGIIWRF